MKGVPVEAIKVTFLKLLGLALNYLASAMDNLSYQDIVENKAVAVLGDVLLKYGIRLSPKYKDARKGDMLYLSKERIYHL